MPLKYIIGIFIIIICTTGYSQSLVINSGSISMKDSTCLTLSKTSLINNGSFEAGDSTTIIINEADSGMGFSGSSEIIAGNMTIESNFSLNTILDLKGNITMSSGLFTLNNNMLLGGEILGEREESRITSNGSAEIIKETTLEANQAINPGNIGIIVTPTANYGQIEIRRGHQSFLNGSSLSINRYYSFPAFDESTQVQFTYLDADLNGLNEKSLVLMGELQNSWVPITNTSADLVNNSYTTTIDQAVTRISLFKGELADIEVPTGFSPNSDGVNDLFVIPGIENFTNNRLIIFNQWGDVLFTASPYRNNWGGESESKIIKTDEMILPDGTYFFVFYPDKYYSQNFKSGPVEIKTEEKQ